MKRILPLFILLSLAWARMYAQPVINLSQVASGFSDITSLAECGDDRLFIVEQRGQIKFIRPYGPAGTTTFMNISDRVSATGGERGLLGLAFDPNYTTNGRFYVNYTTTQNPGSTRISRFQVNPDNPNAGLSNSEEIIMTIPQPYSNHNGGCILFGPDGYLYIAVGDGGSGGDPQNFSQNRQSLLGKMLRIDVSGASGYVVPPSNPFVGDNTTLDEIWAIGVRNPWRFSFDRLTGDMWMGDVGQNLIEEVNFQPASSTGGENYGWKCWEGNNVFSSACSGQPGFTFPVFTYQQSSSNGCSITGGNVYRGQLYNDLYARYFVTDYCSGRFWSLLPDGAGGFNNTNHGQFVNFQYIAFGEDRWGELYVAERGRLMRLNTNAGGPRAELRADQGALAICAGEGRMLFANEHPQFEYAWTFNGEAIAGANSSSYEANQPGDYQVIITAPTGTNESEILTIIESEVPELSVSAGLQIFCESAEVTPVNLTGLPTGGTFSGAGVVNETFIPTSLEAGTYDIQYSLTTAEGCEAQPVSITMTVNAKPEVSIEGLQEIVCLDNAPIELSLSPQGGELSGPGTDENNIFNPQTAGIGIHVIDYSFTDANGCSNTAIRTVEVDECTGTPTLSNTTIHLSPNPVSEMLFVQLTDVANAEIQKIRIHDASGRVCTQFTMEQLDKGLKLDVKALSNGIYTLHIQTTKGQFTRKFIRQAK